MSDKSLKQQIAEMRRSFFDEGLLDDLWTQVESCADKESPNVVEEFTTLFFSGIAKDIDAVEKDLEAEQVNFPIISQRFNKMKGSSSTMGMVRITNKTKEAESLCSAENLEGIQGCLDELKEEVESMKGKIEAYLELQKEARRGK